MIQSFAGAFRASQFAPTLYFRDGRPAAFAALPLRVYETLEALPVGQRVFISRMRRDGTIIEPEPDTVVRPGDVVAVVEDYASWLSASDVPKLFINADPGSILVGRQREFCRRFPRRS